MVMDWGNFWPWEFDRLDELNAGSQTTLHTMCTTGLLIGCPSNFFTLYSCYQCTVINIYYRNAEKILAFQSFWQWCWSWVCRLNLWSLRGSYQKGHTCFCTLGKIYLNSVFVPNMVPFWLLVTKSNCLIPRFSPRAPSLVRKSMSSESKFKRSKHSEAVPSSHSGKSTISKARPNTVPSVDPAMANRRPDDYPTRVTRDHPTSFESFDSDDWRFSSMSRIRKVDSSSDNSSLFSCSDEGSCSTESTRDSTSTDDFSDYLFGETGRGWNSPMRISSDSNGSSPSPLYSRCSPLEVSRSNALDSPDTNGYPTCSASSVPEADGVWMSPSQESSRKEDWEGRGNPPILYSDTTKQCKRLTNHCNNSSSSSCNRETDSKRFGWVNPLDVKSGVSFRRSTRDRTAQTFY